MEVDPSPSTPARTNDSATPVSVMTSAQATLTANRTYTNLLEEKLARLTASLGQVEKLFSDLEVSSSKINGVIELDDADDDVEDLEKAVFVSGGTIARSVLSKRQLHHEVLSL